MAENDVTDGRLDAAAEPWVTGRPMTAQRVPGINEAQDATYVDPEPTSWRRAALIGTAIGLCVTAIFAAIVISDSNGSPKESTVGARAATVTSSRATTTTTGAPGASTTSTPPPTTAATPSTTAAAAPVAAAAAAALPTPRATANPAFAPFTPLAMPAGLSATMSTCAWQPTNGGQYEAAGTMTNRRATSQGWTITIHWLQDNREIAQQSALVPLAGGQVAPWKLTLAAPNPPADPFSCALTGA